MRRRPVISLPPSLVSSHLPFATHAPRSPYVILPIFLHGCTLSAKGSFLEAWDVTLLEYSQKRGQSTDILVTYAASGYGPPALALPVPLCMYILYYTSQCTHTVPAPGSSSATAARPLFHDPLIIIFTLFSRRSFVPPFLGLVCSSSGCDIHHASRYWISPHFPFHLLHIHPIIQSRLFALSKCFPHPTYRRYRQLPSEAIIKVPSGGRQAPSIIYN